jgi:hypothetical protein
MASKIERSALNMLPDFPNLNERTTVNRNLTRELGKMTSA